VVARAPPGADTSYDVCDVGVALAADTDELEEDVLADEVPVEVVAELPVASGVEAAVVVVVDGTAVVVDEAAAVVTGAVVVVAGAVAVDAAATALLVT
jgi:hypothetical protein